MVTEFTALYREHARDLRRFALFLCGDPALADDIAHHGSAVQDFLFASK